MATEDLIDLVEASRVICSKVGVAPNNKLQEIDISFEDWEALDSALRPYATLKAARPEHVAEVTKILTEAFGNERVRVRGAALRIARLMG